jgi:hypothetical protein
MYEELPATIGNLQSLTVLWVAGNRLSGTCIVASRTSATSLRLMSLVLLFTYIIYNRVAVDDRVAHELDVSAGGGQCA